MKPLEFSLRKSTDEIVSESLMDRIRSQSQNKSGELDLSLCKIVQVPLTAIKEHCGYPTGLDLSFNAIRLLSKQFPVEMTQITKLDLSRNELKRLPDNFGAMKDLVYLDIQHNKLETLPMSIGRLSRLQFLALSNNPFRSPIHEVVDNAGSEVSGVTMAKLIVLVMQKIETFQVKRLLLLTQEATNKKCNLPRPTKRRSRPRIRYTLPKVVERAPAPFISKSKGQPEATLKSKVVGKIKTESGLKTTIVGKVKTEAEPKPTTVGRVKTESGLPKPTTVGKVKTEAEPKPKPLTVGKVKTESELLMPPTTEISSQKMEEPPANAEEPLQRTEPDENQNIIFEELSTDNPNPFLSKIPVKTEVGPPPIIMEKLDKVIQEILREMEESLEKMEVDATRNVLQPVTSSFISIPKLKLEPESMSIIPGESETEVEEALTDVEKPLNLVETDENKDELMKLASENHLPATREIRSLGIIDVDEKTVKPVTKEILHNYFNAIEKIVVILLVWVILIPLFVICVSDISYLDHLAEEYPTFGGYWSRCSSCKHLVTSIPQYLMLPHSGWHLKGRPLLEAEIGFWAMISSAISSFGEFCIYVWNTITFSSS